MSISFSAGTGLLIVGVFLILLIVPGVTDIISDLFKRQVRPVWRNSTKIAFFIFGFLLVFFGLITIFKLEIPVSSDRVFSSTETPTLISTPALANTETPISTPALANTETLAPILPSTLASTIVPTLSQCQNIQQPICATILLESGETVVCPNSQIEVKLGELKNLIGQALLEDDQICNCKWEVKNSNNKFEPLNPAAQRCSFSLDLGALATTVDKIILKLIIEGYSPEPFVIKIKN